MAQGKRDRLSTEQRIDMWRRWKAGDSLHEIGRAFGKAMVPFGSCSPKVRIRVGLSHCDPGCAGYPFTERWHSELSNAVEGFWNPVSIESVAPEAIEMFGLVWTGRRDEFCIERMSFCRELFQCFAHGHDVVKDQQVSCEMVVLDELALLSRTPIG